MSESSYLSVLDEFVDLAAVGDIATIEQQLASHSSTKLGEMCVALWASLPRPIKSDAPHRFVANSALSGLPYPCSGFDCRAENLSQAAAFAAIYASEIVLFNPFRRLVSSPPNKSGQASRRMYLREVSFHVAELLLLRPLIDRGMCTFVDEQTHNFCRDCFNRALDILISGQSDGIPRRDMYFDLMSHYADSVQVHFSSYMRSRGHFVLRGPIDLIPHEETNFYIAKKHVPFELESDRVLSRDEVLTLGIAGPFSHYTTSDLVKSSSVTSEFGVGNVIASTQHMSILRRHFGDSTFSKSVDVEYPLISGAKLDDVISFREEEWHHLHDFRTTVEEGLKSGLNVNDALMASSANISRILAKSARTFKIDLVKEVALAAVGITATIATSGVSNLVALAFGALSGGHLATNVVPKLVERATEPEDIRAEKSYYAWKVSRKLSH